MTSNLESTTLTEQAPGFRMEVNGKSLLLDAHPGIRNLDRDVPYARMHDVIQVLKETGFVSRVVISSRPPGSQRNSQSETTFPDSNAPSGNTN